MAETPSADALAAEFDCLMARAGITVPPQRRAAALVAYADLRGQIALLHGRYGPEAEPSNVFRPGRQMMDTQDLSIVEMGRLLRSGSVTSETLARDALARVAARDGALHAFVLVTEDRALEDARRADAELKAGRDRGPFHGIPYALKDIYDTAGIRTTCHSKLRLNVVPKEDSVAAARLREAGGVLLGKLATHEFAIGGPSFDLPFPPARNPWNPQHVTGGSSSGSGTAIGARMVRMAMGSDTGGSIRGPAAWCGTVGIKATYGRVSRRGVFPLSWTLDHIGPLTRSVEDAAITLQVLAGHDPQRSRQRRCSRARLSRRSGEGRFRSAHRHPARLLRHGIGDDRRGGGGPRPHRGAAARGGCRRWRTSNCPTTRCSRRSDA